MAKSNQYLGSTLEDLLEETGEQQEAETIATKRVTMWNSRTENTVSKEIFTMNTLSLSVKSLKTGRIYTNDPSQEFCITDIKVFNNYTLVCLESDVEDILLLPSIADCKSNVGITGEWVQGLIKTR